LLQSVLAASEWRARRNRQSASCAADFEHRGRAYNEAVAPAAIVGHE
jgi:hypothetical protein